ncbi:TadE family type IV pilus minor pilin [Streptomyces sp. NPDC056437]|uniref:TadE family type IV pilus minor pilin n=1 Tax=Streptomyces sp. NPDC056437 TaxID=3345816 RepID=UPI0036A60B37
MRSSEIRRGKCGEGDRGSVTAEAAVAVPALVVFAMALVWALMAASAQIQCVDAARAGARAAARSEPPAAAVATARSAAPDGARVTVGRTGDLWRVRVEAAAPGPGALGLTLSAEAAAFAEDAVGDAPGSDSTPGGDSEPAAGSGTGGGSGSSPAAAAASGGAPATDGATREEPVAASGPALTPAAAVALGSGAQAQAQVGAGSVGPAAPRRAAREGQAFVPAAPGPAPLGGPEEVVS